MAQLQKSASKASHAFCSYSRKLLAASLSAVFALSLAPAAMAENYGWTGASDDDNNYSTPANWGVETGYPGAGDGAMFTEAAAEKTVMFNGTYSPDWVWVATRDVSKPVTWEADDSENGMTVSGNIGVADGDNTDGAQVGALKILSGTYKANGFFKVGYGAATAAKVEILGGSVTVNGSEAETFLDNALPNGTFAAKIGSGLGFAADITVQDAAVSFPNGDIGLGFWGAWPDAYDSETVNSNHLAVGHLTVDVNANGTLSCGTEESPRGLFLGGYGVEPITVNINQGGTLCVGRIYRLSASNGSVNINGGTIKVLGSYNGAFIANDGIAYTVDGNATLNTNGKEITIAAVIGGTGTLNVIGGGSVTFTVAPECTVEPDSETEVIYPSVEPSSDYAVYAWNDIFTADFEDENTYLSGWTRSTDMAANYTRLERPGTDGQHYLAYYAYAHGNVRGTTATYTIPSEAIDRITSEGAYEIELDWFATVGYAGRTTDSLHSFFKVFAQDTVIAAIDAVTVYNGGANGVDATVYKYGEVATEATVHTAPRGSDSSDASKAEYWYHVSLKANPNGVYLTVAKPDGTEVVSNLFVSDYVVMSKLVVQVQSRLQGDDVVAGIDNIKINVPVFSTADGETYIVAAGSQYGSDAEDTIDVSAQASVLAGKTIVKKGEGTLVLTGLSADSVCNVNVEDGTLVLPAGAKAGAVAVSEGAHLLVDVTGCVDGQVVFTYSSISGDVSLRGLDSSAAIATNTVDGTTTWTISRAAKTYTWNGADGADWTVAANWLVDDEEATSMPTADDTLIFTGSASVYVPWESRSVGTVQVLSGTLTVNPGVIFASLTLENGAKLAFDMSGWNVGAVGASSELVTVNAGNVTVNDIVAPANCTGVYAAGVFTATRVASTYTWAGTGTAWSQPSSWRVNGVAVGNVPGEADTVEFLTSEVEDFNGWTVSLSGDVYVETVTLNADVTLSGARTLKAHTINGAAELKLSNANIGCNGQDIVVNCPLNILPETTDYIYLSGYNATLNGALYGSGKLVSDANETSYRGVAFKGDVSGFYGEFESTKHNGRDQTDMTAPAVGSENAVWRINPNPGTGSAHQSTHFVIHDSETTYKFGAYVGGFWVGNITTPHIEIGNRDDVDSSFSLTSYGSRSRFVFTKVGNGVMTITNVKGDQQIGTLNANGGTSIIRTLPGTITFGGGALRTPIYNVVVGKAYTYVYVNENDETDVRELDVDMGASFSEDAVVYNLKETRTSDVMGPYYPDVSSVIKDSTGPIWFDTGDADYTWATALDGSNTNGLTKAGTGTLTLEKEPYYTGVTWVQAGTLVVPEGTSITLDPRSLGTVSGVTVENYAYRPDTVLDGTETDDDSRDGNIDVSGIRKIDISDPSYVTALVNQRRVVLCGTTGSITGLDFRHFVQGETLLVPERPEEVSEKNWDWSVRIMQVDGKRCLCVAPRVVPFAIRIR